MALDTETFFAKRLYTTNMGYQNNIVKYLFPFNSLNYDLRAF